MRRSASWRWKRESFDDCQNARTGLIARVFSGYYNELSILRNGFLCDWSSLHGLIYIVRHYHAASRAVTDAGKSRLKITVNLEPWP